MIFSWYKRFIKNARIFYPQKVVIMDGPAQGLLRLRRNPAGRLRTSLLALPLLLALAGCGNPVKETLAKETLRGKSIGLMLGYSSDYILSRPEYGLKVFRYDSYGDMQMALRFNRVDGIVMEKDEADVLCRLEPDYKAAFAIHEQEKYAYPIHSANSELVESFNAFIREFREGPEYADLLARRARVNEVPYEAKKVESTARGDRVLRVALYQGWEPISYVNTVTGEWEGSDVELITHYANHEGYRIEWIDTGSWNQMVLNLAAGKVDLFLCPDSLALAKDLEMAGSVIFSEWVWLKDMMCVVNNTEETR